MSLPGLRVNLDSLHEVECLLTAGLLKGWHVGLRFQLSLEHDPDEPSYSTQFGLSIDEATEAVKVLRQAGIPVEAIHFHLRSNIEGPEVYQQAISEVAEFCRIVDLQPKYLDVGGGLPARGEISRSVESRPEFHLGEYARVILDAKRQIPSLEECWAENGRFLTSDSGILVVKVLDIKHRRAQRFVICDGGRTNHAIISDWERHTITTYPTREFTSTILTTVCGPTCMAFDRLDRILLPSNLRIGDYLLWHNAGAYHIPWETRFSHGLSAVLWSDDEDSISVVREPEDFTDWWTAWSVSDG